MGDDSQFVIENLGFALRWGIPLKDQGY